MILGSELLRPTHSKMTITAPISASKITKSKVISYYSY